MRTILHRIKLLAVVGCTATLLALPGRAAAVDTKDPKDQTTEERLQEQDQRIKELEQRLQNMESTAMTGTAPGPERAPADKVNAQTRETQQLMTGADLVAEKFPGSWPMFGTDMRIKLGGYVKADLLYDFDGTTDKYQFLMSTIPVEGTPEYENNGYVSFFARETRINIDVRRATPGAVPLTAFVEGDFWSSGNQFRLRHAFMTVGDFLIGQTWTTISFLESLPFIIDFASGDALFGGRDTQVRYTKKVNDQWKMAVALESFDQLGIENPNNLGGAASAQLPQLAIRADYKWRTGQLWLGASAAQLRWDGGATGPNAVALQIDGVVAGKQYLGTDNYFTWNISYGEGSGENIIAFAGSEANAVLNANGELDTMPAFAGILGFWHKWNEQFSSNLCYAYGWLDTPDSRDPLALKEGGIGHVNLIWQPVKQFSTGIEFMYGEQRTQNDAKGSASRIQTMAKYEF